jgi:hypothetical protein
MGQLTHVQTEQSMKHLLAMYLMVPVVLFFLTKEETGLEFKILLIKKVIAYHVNTDLGANLVAL